MSKLALKIISGAVALSMCSLLAAGCSKNDGQSNDSSKQQSSSVSQAVKDSSETDTDTKTEKAWFPQCIWGFDDMDTYIKVEGYERTDFGYKFKLSAIELGKPLPVQGYLSLVNVSGSSEHSPIIYDTYNCYLSLDGNLSNGEFQKVDINKKIDCENEKKTVYAYVYMPDIEPEQLPGLKFIFGDKNKRNELDDTIQPYVFTLQDIDDKTCNERVLKLSKEGTHKGSNTFLKENSLGDVSGYFEGAEIVSNDTLKFKFSHIRSIIGNSRFLELDGENEKEVKVYAYKGTEPVSFLKFKFDISKNKFTTESAEDMTVQVSGLDISKYDKVIIKVYDTIPGGRSDHLDLIHDNENILTVQTASDWKDIAK